MIDSHNYLLGDLVESISITHSFNRDELIFLNTSDVLNGKILHTNYSPVKDMPGQAKKSIQQGDILFSEIRPANGRYAYVDFEGKDYVVSTKLMVIRTKQPDVLPKFIYYFLTQRQTTDHLQYLAESRSGTFPQITFDQIAALEINLPQISTQQNIVSMLESIDDLVDTNKSMNATLEKIAQAIYKQWFVEFEFPDVKGRPYRSSGGMMVGTDSLTLLTTIPDLIPANWVPGSLGDLAVVSTGKGIHRREYVENGPYPIWGANGELGRLDKFIYDDTLILTGRVGTLGSLNLVRGKCWISDNVLITKPNIPIALFYLYQGMKRIDFSNMNRGSTQPLITQTDLKQYGMLIPPHSILEKYHFLAKSIYDQIFHNEDEIKTLEGIRDRLLPRLFSGKIAV